MDPNGILEWDLRSGVIRRLEKLLCMEDCGLEHHRTQWRIFQQAMFDYCRVEQPLRGTFMYFRELLGRIP